MATIKPRKSKFSVIYWYVNEDGEKKQKWDTLDTKKEAKTRKSFVEYYQQVHGSVLVPLQEQFAKEIQKAKESISELNSSNSNGDIAFREFLEIFVNLYGASKWSVTTYSHKTGAIKNYINPYIGDLKLNEITTKRLSLYYNELLNVPEVPRCNGKPTSRCVQPANIKKIHDIIRCALNQAIRWEYLDTKMRNPASLATLPKITKVRRKVWNIDTFKEAIQLAEDDLLLVCMQLAFSCSMRIGEITGLTWDDVIIDEQSIAENNAKVIINKELARISIHAMHELKSKDILKVFPTQKANCSTVLVLKTPKTETSNRIVWLPKTVALLLVKYKKEQAEMREFLGDAYNNHGLAIALDNGNPVESRIVRDRFQTLCEANNFETVVFHSLRHLSTGYKLKMTNGDVKSVQGDTGHAEAEMVMDVYSRVLDEDRRFNAQKLDKQFYGSLQETTEESENKSASNDMFLANLVDFLKDKNNRQQLQELLNQTNS